MKTIWVSEITFIFEFLWSNILFQIVAILSYLEMGIFAIPSVLDELPNEETIPAFDIVEHGNGFHQYDDMILDDVQDRLFRNVETELDRQAMFGEKYRWPGGLIPYKFDESTGFDETKKNLLRDYAEKFTKQMEGCLTIR